MKVLFVNPPDELKLVQAPDEDGNSYLDSDDYGNFPPLGLLYLLSYLEKHDPEHEIYFKDCIAERISHAEFAEVVRQIKPDVVGLTSFTISMVDVCKAAETVREIQPNAFIVLGGHHPIAFPHEAAQLPHFDCTVVGEGEIAFAQIMDALKTGDREKIPSITGVYTRESIKEWETKHVEDRRLLKSVNVPVAYIDNIDALPIPNRKYIQHIDYNSIVGKHKKLATILSTRGCPYLCTFCDVPYKKYRTRTMCKVVDEIEVCLGMGYKEFHFYDDLFNITSQKVIDFCDEVERRGLKFTWDFRGRVNAVSRESLRRAKRAGCRMISFGVETGSNEGLKYLKKGTTVEKVSAVFGWCREMGILTIADFIIGFPFERTREDVLKNLAFLKSLDPDYALVSVLMTLPNTPLYEEAVQKGLVPKDKWSNFAKNPTRNFEITHWEEHLSMKELFELKQHVYRSFYLRPKKVVRSVLQTRSWFEFYSKVRGVFRLRTG